MTPEKLLDYKLKYMAALKEEFIEPNQDGHLYFGHSKVLEAMINGSAKFLFWSARHRSKY